MLSARQGAAGTGDRTAGGVYDVVPFDRLAHQTVIGLTGDEAAP
jgi:hypothetical protein